jgi:TonB family protein
MTREPEPTISVAAQPVDGRGVLGKIPLLGRIRRNRQEYVPPSPVHQPKPSLTAREKQQLTALVPIDVKVYVNDAGKVEYAEVMSGAARHGDLAAAAEYAARRWDFVPARRGDDKVPGEVILHFKFAPPEPPAAITER